MEWKLSEFSELRESDKLLKHEFGSIKDPVCYLCLAGTVVVFWSLSENI